jgi:hypothetical protein
VIHVPDDVTEISPEFLQSCDLNNVSRVLFHTRNSDSGTRAFAKISRTCCPKRPSCWSNVV